MINVVEAVQPIVVKPAKRAAYYRFLHVFIELLEKHNIRYFAHSGTMLGCVRHNGFIPWDDDVDLMIPEEDVPRLEEMVQVIEKYGIRQNLKNKITPKDGLWQFMPFGPKIMQGVKGYMGLDIFVGEEVELADGTRVYHYKSTDFRRWYKARYVEVDDVFPRKRYAFGPLSVWGMRDPSAYFDRSGFLMDEAIIGVHAGSKAKAEAVIADLKAANVYPIRDPHVLSMEAPFKETDFLDLEFFRDEAAALSLRERAVS